MKTMGKEYECDIKCIYFTCISNSPWPTTFQQNTCSELAKLETIYIYYQYRLSCLWKLRQWMNGLKIVKCPMPFQTFRFPFSFTFIGSLKVTKKMLQWSLTEHINFMSVVGCFRWKCALIPKFYHSSNHSALEYKNLVVYAAAKKK